MAAGVAATIAPAAVIVEAGGCLGPGARVIIGILMPVPEARAFGC